MSLLKQYSSALNDKLNQLWYQNYVVLERWELLSWYDRTRITNIVWRDILERWQEFFDQGDADALSVIACDDTTTPQKFILVRLSAAKDIEGMS